MIRSHLPRSLSRNQIGRRWKSAEGLGLLEDAWVILKNSQKKQATIPSMGRLRILTYICSLILRILTYICSLILWFPGGASFTKKKHKIPWIPNGWESGGEVSSQLSAEEKPLEGWSETSEAHRFCREISPGRSGSPKRELELWQTCQVDQSLGSAVWWFRKKQLVGGFKYFLLSPPGEDEPNLTHIFQRGWNHQLGRCSPKDLDVFNHAKSGTMIFMVLDF